MGLIKPYRNVLPRFGARVFLAETSAIIGDVTVGDDSSIWYHTIVRGDVNNIIIGARTNIQDGTVIHVSSTTQGTYIGDDVTVGHMALLHACTIGHRVLIGMQACVMDDAIVEDDVIIAAGALVTGGKHVKSGQLWAGRPAVYKRDLTQQDFEFLRISASRYVALKNDYAV